MDPEEEIDDMPEGALPGLSSYKNVGDWSGAMNALAGEQVSFGREEETERKQLYDTVRKAILERRYGPSDAERWYALSAAIGTPMARPSFGGVMRNVSMALGDFNKAKREGEISRADALMALDQSVLNAKSAAKQAEFEARRKALAPQGAVLARAAADAAKPNYRVQIGTDNQPHVIPSKVHFPNTPDEFNAVPVGEYYMVPSGPDTGKIIRKQG